MFIHVSKGKCIPRVFRCNVKTLLETSLKVFVLSLSKSVDVKSFDALPRRIHCESKECFIYLQALAGGSGIAWNL